MFIINVLHFFLNSVALVSTGRVRSVCHLSAFHTYHLFILPVQWPARHVSLCA